MYFHVFRVHTLLHVTTSVLPMHNKEPNMVIYVICHSRGKKFSIHEHFFLVKRKGTLFN